MVLSAQSQSHLFVCKQDLVLAVAARCVLKAVHTVVLVRSSCTQIMTSAQPRLHVIMRSQVFGLGCGCEAS